jgi:hypothetical protein
VAAATEPVVWISEVIVNRLTSVWLAPIVLREARASPDRVPATPELASRRPNRLWLKVPVPTKLFTRFSKKPAEM